MTKRLLQQDDDYSKTGAHWLSAESISILGSSYLRHIEMASRRKDEGVGTDSLSVEVSDKNAIRGVKFTLGLRGLQAIALIYDDGSCSAWLGDPENGWHGRAYGDRPELL